MSQTLHFITEPAKQIPVLLETDVVICGGGPSGFIAAIAAARNGARTLLLEQYGFLGGMATAALVGPISKFNFHRERIVAGIPEEFINSMARKGGAIVDLPSGNIPYDPEVYKSVSMDMSEEAGADMLLHANVVGCIEEPEHPGRITHILIENKSGRQAIAAKFVIDCTGTGDIVSRSAMPWEMRNMKDGNLQPMTLYFRLGGVDTAALNLRAAEDGVKYANRTLNELLMEEVEAGRLSNFGGPWAMHGSTIRNGEVSVNATRYKGNAADGQEISAAERQLRKDVGKIIQAFRQKAPAFKNAYLIDTAAQVGIRETRGITGLYTMELKDILEPGHFADTIAYGGHPVDIHRPGDPRQDVSFLRAPYPIPYRSIIPKGSDNLLVAGSCLSASHEAFASIRVQAQCMALGQAAGTAAALCLQNGVSVAALDGAYLRSVLKQQGAFV